MLIKLSFMSNCKCNKVFLNFVIVISWIDKCINIKIFFIFNFFPAIDEEGNGDVQLRGSRHRLMRELKLGESFIEWRSNFLYWRCYCNPKFGACWGYIILFYSILWTILIWSYDACTQQRWWTFLYSIVTGSNNF